MSCTQQGQGKSMWQRHAYKTHAMAHAPHWEIQRYWESELTIRHLMLCSIQENHLCLNYNAVVFFRERLQMPILQVLDTPCGYIYIRSWIWSEWHKVGEWYKQKHTLLWNNCRKGYPQAGHCCPVCPTADSSPQRSLQCQSTSCCTTSPLLCRTCP